MLWKKGRQSENVEDRRGAGIGGASIKLSGGMLAIVILIGVLLGENPLELLAMLSQGYLAVARYNRCFPQTNAWQR